MGVLKNKKNVAGDFTNAGDVKASNFAEWNISANLFADDWYNIINIDGEVRAMLKVGDIHATNIVVYNSETSVLEAAGNGGLNGQVNAMVKIIEVEASDDDI